MNRKGFILNDEYQSMEQIQDYKQRGARYFVAERSYLNHVPGFETELRSQFTVLEERGNTLLLDLGPSDALLPGASQASNDLSSGGDRTERASADT